MDPAARSGALAPANRVAALLAVCSVAALTVPHLRGEPPSALFFDDFFYYAVTAERLVETGRLEFFPGILTNGFHPLWEAVVVALRWLVRSDGPFLVAVAGVACAALLWTVFLLRRLLLDLGGPLGAALGMLVAAPSILVLGASGMEVVLTLPLLCLLLLRLCAEPLATRSAAALAGVGGIAALTILSRLDSALLVAPLLAVAVVESRPELARAARAAVWLGLGLLPVALYVGANWLYLDTWLPVSGQAKQLKTELAPSLRPLLEGWSTAPAIRIPLAVAGLAWLGGVAALATRPASTADPRRRLLVATLLASPLWFYVVHCSVSDWQLWFWYIYPWPVATACGAALVPAAYAAKLSRQTWRITLGLLSAIALLTTNSLLQRSPNWLHAIDSAIVAQIAANPGRYAMGDCAGTVAFLSKQPILQTEGLVMDRAFLAGIAAERDLIEVLREHQVDVYVTLRARPVGACFEVSEPALAGPRSPRMRGRFCAPPRFVVEAEGVTAWGFDVPREHDGEPARGTDPSG
jgi:hypothetical protein